MLCKRGKMKPIGAVGHLTVSCIENTSNDTRPWLVELSMLQQSSSSSTMTEQLMVAYGNANESRL